VSKKRPEALAMSYRNEYGNGALISDAAGEVARTGIFALSKGTVRIARPGSGAIEAGEPAKLRLAGGLIARALRGSVVRFEKVLALRKAIAAGTYVVAAADLADRLMDKLQTVEAGSGCAYWKA
jgi:hypothetical protein